MASDDPNRAIWLAVRQVLVALLRELPRIVAAIEREYGKN